MSMISELIEELIDNADLYTKELHDLMYRAADTIGMLSEKVRASKQEWIPCSERLPKKEEETYLICTDGGYMCSCRWTNDMYGLGSNEWSEWGWHILDKPQHTKVVAWSEMKPWKGADDGSC